MNAKKDSGTTRDADDRSPTDLLAEIAAYCKRAGMAQSTFGRRAVNDGKLVARLRAGGRIKAATLDRVRIYLRHAQNELQAISHASRPAETSSNRAQFRFFDNRQKYLLFVSTCTEKAVVSQRIELELEHIEPRAPALRMFDAGVGDGTVLSRVMRTLHDRFPTVPFYIVGKEISLEDTRLALEKMPDRFYEHPATVLVMTNMRYGEAPWLRPSTAAENRMVWREVALTGSTAGQFERQIAELHTFLKTQWTTRVSRITGNPIYERPIALVVYRQDHKMLLGSVLPRKGDSAANFDLVIASQPYRARSTPRFKAEKIVVPLARALGPGGRLIGIHSHGGDPALEIIQSIWPGEQPFTTSRHELLQAAKDALGSEAVEFSFNAYSDQRALFRYEMHTLPAEIGPAIGTSTLMAAWNDAVYVAQIDDERLESAMRGGAYLDATRAVLQKHGKLWFQNESYVVSRHRGDRSRTTERA